MTRSVTVSLTLLADASEADSDCVGFFLTIGLLLLPLLPLIWMLKRAMGQNRTIVNIAETQIELQRQQTELQRRTNELLEQLISGQENG